MVESLVEVDHHDHAGFHRDSKQRDVPHPDRHAEVVAEEPLQDQSARHCVKGRKRLYEIAETLRCLL